MNDTHSQHLLGSARMFPLFSITFAGIAVVIFLAIFVNTPLCVIRPAYVWLPSAESEQAVLGSERDFPLTVRADGMLLLGQLYVRPDQLRAELSRVTKVGTDRTIILRIDRRAPFRQVRHVIAELSEAGFARGYVLTFEGTPMELLSRRPARN